MQVSGELIAQVDPALLAWLDADPRPSLIVDQVSTLHFLNEAYVDSVRAGPAGDAFFAEWGLGSRLLDACHGQVKHVIQRGLDQALTSQRLWQHRYPCHTPDSIQHFLVSVQPLGGSGMLLLTHVRVERLEADGSRLMIEPDLQAAHYDADGYIVRCCGCQLVRRQDDPSQWELVAAAFSERPRAPVRIGLCPTCTVAYEARLQVH